MITIAILASFAMGVTIFWANRERKRPLLTAAGLLLGGPIVWATYVCILTGRVYGALRTAPAPTEWDRETHRLLAAMLVDSRLDSGATVLRPDHEAAIMRLLSARKELFAFGDPVPVTTTTDAP